MVTSDVFPPHECGLTLTHNEHRNYYQSITEFLANDGVLLTDEELPPEERARCIANDEIWTLQWYPHTPVGFSFIAAPTLAELLAKVQR